MTKLILWRSATRRDYRQRISGPTGWGRRPISSLTAARQKGLTQAEVRNLQPGVYAYPDGPEGRKQRLEVVR